MSLNKDLVEVGRTADNEPIIHCAHCHREAKYGEDDYTLRCPESSAADPLILGSWTDEPSRVNELRDYIKVKTRPKPSA